MSDLIAFHIDVNDGDVRRCSRPDNCGWAEPDEHYRTPEEARAAYEKMSQPFAWVRFHKRNENGSNPHHSHVMQVVQPLR